MKISYKYFRCCLSPCKIANKSKEKEKFKEKIYIYIYALCRACLLDCVLRSKPEGSSRSRVHRMTRWNEVAFDSSLLGRGDCAIAVPHATELDTVVARFAGVESTLKNISTFKEKWMGSGEKYIHYGKVWKSIFLPIIGVIYANSSRNFYTCRLHCKFASEKLFRPDTFGPMQKLFPQIKLPRQLSPGSGAFVSFRLCGRDRSM